MSNDLCNMMALDIYLSSLKDVKYNKITTMECNYVKVPLMSWDIFSNTSFSNMHSVEKRQDIASIKELSKQLNWQNNIDSIFENQNFEAIIVTDINQSILWVNGGFSKMTGYSETETLYKTPRFLQGTSTSKVSKNRIRKNLINSTKPFKDIIINHKKNGDTYKCEVKIFPLFSNNNKSHYIALERQVG